jgi:hypothetical protein
MLGPQRDENGNFPDQYEEPPTPQETFREEPPTPQKTFREELKEIADKLNALIFKHNLGGALNKKSSKKKGRTGTRARLSKQKTERHAAHRKR